MSLFNGPDYDASLYLYGDGLGPVYSNWDANSIMVCECDPGHFGADCSLIMCPKGDDPLTINQNQREIFLTVETYSGRDLSGQLGLQFQGTRVYLSLTNPTSGKCSSDLSYQGKFGLVNCIVRIVNTERFYFTLTFINWPIYPLDNNLFDNNGNPSATAFSCDRTRASFGAQCIFTDVISENIQEYAPCANRGTCDTTTGLCACNPGYGGPNCGNASYLYFEGASALPGLEVKVAPLNFSSSVLQLASVKSRASDFYLIEALAGDEQVFYVRGDGVMSVDRLQTLKGGMTIAAGGLFVGGGGVTVNNDGVVLYSSDSTLPVLTVASSYANTLSASYHALEVSTEGQGSNNHYLIVGKNQGVDKFLVRADGGVFIKNGGLRVTGGLSVNSGGINVADGLTVSTNGLTVAAAGLTVTGGATINNVGLKILGGGLQVYAGGASIYAAGLKVVGGITINSGAFTVTGGASINNAGLTVTGGATINDFGLRVSGGLTLTGTRGLYVTAGGETILAGGLTVTGGATINTGGLYITSGGVTINNGGLFVTAGVTIITGGLQIGNGGATIGAGGFQVAGGVSITSSGLAIAGGGLTVSTGNVNINSGNLQVSGTISVGLGSYFSNSVSIFGNSFYVSGSTTINTDLYVGGQATITGTLTNPSDRRLKTSIIPIDNALDKVRRLNGVYFHWQQDAMAAAGLKGDTRRHVGLIAQEVRAVLPELVVQRPPSAPPTQLASQLTQQETEEQEGILSVDYLSIAPLLVEAIHDLDRRLSLAHPSPIVSAVGEEEKSEEAKASGADKSLATRVEQLEKEVRELRAMILTLTSAKEADKKPQELRKR